MKLPSAAGFDERQAIVEILSALEYEKKKEERDILDAFLRDHGVTRVSKDKLARLICTSPGFERFFLTILNQVRPFSLMLAEIYDFLNTQERTTSRRASKFLVRSDVAKATLEFDLSNFPKELIRFIGEVEMFGMLSELRFEGINLDDPSPQWDQTQAAADWRAVSPSWDNDFYDDGFHRALSYANTIIGEGDPGHKDRIEVVARPILDRLAAIRDFTDSLRPPEQRIIGEANIEYMTGERGSHLSLAGTPARFHRVRDARAPAFLAHASQIGWNNSERTVLDELWGEVEAFAASINFYEDPSLRRSDVKWVAERLGCDPSHITPERYLELLALLADEYRARLDRVAPVIGDYSYQNTVERFLEFLSLPFWKNRWFLYELWTLICVLRTAQRVAQVELKNIIAGSGGTLEWVLPGGAARAPVATIGGSHQINCWSQRKTYHPGTKAGLEPDLRLTMSAPSFHDILIVENKDRLTATGSYLDEILNRYVGGTCADSVWLVNYEQFSPSTVAGLASRWPGRRVEVVSNFKPGQLPPEFEDDVENILRRYLPSPEVLEESVAKDSSVEGFSAQSSAHDEARLAPSLTPVEATLAWQGPPRDLDLHAWIKFGAEVHHISFQARGDIATPPYAELDNDHTGGDGQETLRISRDGFESVVLAVHNYSSEANLSGMSATLRLNVGGRHLLLRVPHGSDDRWWHVVNLNGLNGEVEVLQNLSHSLPSNIF